MIPKKIHYIWVGNAEKSDLVHQCIKSWQEFCPDYEIIEWGNKEALESGNQYVIEAHSVGKWAFVSDYLRLKALAEHGGFYFDTDLELTRDISGFRSHQFVTGYQNYRGKAGPVTALIGAQKGNRIVSDLLSQYDDIPFLIEGVPDQTTNVTRIANYFSDQFQLSKPYNGNEITKLTEGAFIYPSNIFCTPQPDKDNYSIHHFNGSWLDAFRRKKIISIGSLQLLKFKKRANSTLAHIALADTEKPLAKLKISKTRTLILIQKKKP